MVFDESGANLHDTQARDVTCSAPGTVTVMASAPQHLSFSVNNGVQNTWNDV
jgi:hypothetical protein